MANWGPNTHPFTKEAHDRGNLRQKRYTLLCHEWGWEHLAVPFRDKDPSKDKSGGFRIRLASPEEWAALQAEYARRWGGGGSGLETDKEKAERLQREFEEAKKTLEEKIARQEKKIRRQGEALERQPGNKREGSRREKEAIVWLKSLEYTSLKRTSPKAPGYDIDGMFPDGKSFQGEVKPKGELFTEKEETFAREHQDSWRLLEFDRKTRKFKMYTYAQCVWKQKIKVFWRVYSIKISGAS